MGCGDVASFGHLPALTATPGLELAALYDPDATRAQSLARKFGNPPTFTVQSEFFDCDLDAVVVTSPAWAHRENVLEAAERGIHVLCEKPIAMDDSDAEEMIQAMKDAGKHLFVGFVYRFSPVAKQIRQWVREGVVGQIRSLRLIYIWDLHGRYAPGPDGNWIESPRWRGRMLEGGPMVDCGVHQVDLARWWLGSDVVRYEASGAWVADYEAPDHVYLHLDHASGAHTMVEVSFTFGHTAHDPMPLFTYQLIGDGGILRYDRDGYILEARTGQGVVRVPGASEKNFSGMYAEFENALRTGDVGDMPTAEDGLAATRIARHATESVMARRVTLKEQTLDKETEPR